jgi:hypothetical protein
VKFSPQKSVERAKVKPKLPTLWAWESFEQKQIKLKDSLFFTLKNNYLEMKLYDF